MVFVSAESSLDASGDDCDDWSLNSGGISSGAGIGRSLAAATI